MQSKIIRIKQPDTAPLNLTWVVNNICTNHCSYCPENLHNGTNHNYDWENARKFFKILFERYPKIHCSASGGEPSVSPFFPELVKLFYDNGHTIGVTSNAAKPASYWADISKYLQYICFSYHAEFADPKFLDKVDASAENTFTTVRIMMHPTYWDQCVDMYKQVLAKNTVFVEPVRILDWGVPNTKLMADSYTPDQVAWFNTNIGNHSSLILDKFLDRPVLELWADYYLDDGTVDAHGSATDYTNKGMTNFHGYVCEAGIKGLFINAQGDVNLANCEINGTIGNLNAPENIMWPTGPVVCNKNLCHCSSDVNLNKWIP